MIINPPNQNLLLALVLTLGGVLAYQVGSAFAVLLMQQTSLLTAIYLKSIGTCVLATAVIIFMRCHIYELWHTKKRKYFLIFLMFCLIDSIGWMGSIYYNGLTGSAILSKLIPLTLTLYGVIILKENLTKYQWVAGGFMIIASLFFSAHAFQTGTIAGLIFQAILIFGYCGFAIMQKNLTDTHNPYATMWARATLVAIAVIPFTPFVITEISEFDFMIFLYLFLLASLFGFMNGFVKHSLTMLSYRYAPMSFLSLVSEISLPLSFLVGFFIFEESMSPIKWAAAAIAFIASIILIVGQIKKSGSE